MDFTKVPYNPDDNDGDENEDEEHFSSNDSENSSDGNRIGDDEDDEEEDNVMDNSGDQNDNDNEIGDEDDDDEDDDDDDDDDEDDEGQIVADINRLQDELSINPYDYDKHVRLISKLKMIGELDLLRSAREKMNEIYPLSPKQWNEWIEDEKSVCTTVENQRSILKLYERATFDYLDINIWLDYVQFAVKLVETLGVDEVRKIIDKSLVQAGLHIPQGTLIWNVYRDLESFILDHHSPQKDVQTSVREQIHRIYDLYRRQLSIPLFRMGETMEEFEKWIEEIKNLYEIDLKIETEKDYSQVKLKYEKALKKLDSLKPFEEKLSNADQRCYELYKEYLESEKKSNDLARTQCLFERAITDDCLQKDLWLDYLKFCDSKFSISQILLPIYERAVRNCYWEAQIWIRYMEAIERVGNDQSPSELKKQVAMVLEKALKNVSFEYHHGLWMTYLHCLRRQTNKSGWENLDNVEQLRKSFTTAIDQLEPYQDADYCYDFYKYNAKVEAEFCKNVENGRKIWNDFLDKSNSLKYQTNTWLDFAEFESRYGDNEHYKKTLLKGIENSSDYPENLGEILLKFERETSDEISQYDSLLNKYEKVMKKIEGRRLKQQHSFAQKRKLENNNSDVSKSKKSKTEPQKSKNPPQVHGQTIKTDESKRDQTIFVSNLDFAVDENELRKVFEKFGPIREARLVRNYKGLSKGFGYVEFDQIESVKKALANDRMLIQERPVFISEMDKRKNFQYERNKEENKLFIKNIPPEVTKDGLIEKVFSDYKDSIVDARLVTFRNGYSKGIAYVELKDAQSALKVVNEKNGFEIGDRKLEIAISDPSKAKLNSKDSVQNQKKPRGPSAPMVPYSVLRVKSNPSKVKLQLNSGDFSSDSKNQDQNSDSESGSQKSTLNNDQFRAMFLNKS